MRGKNGFDENLLYVMLSKSKIGNLVTGGVQAKLNQVNMFSLQILIPDKITLVKIKDQLRPLFYNKFVLQNEIEIMKNIVNFHLKNH